jgi:hypothetical protein
MIKDRLRKEQEDVEIEEDIINEQAKKILVEEGIL